MKTLTYETTRGTERTITLERKVAENVYCTAKGQYITIQGSRVLSSTNGSTPRHIGYVA